MELKEGQRVLCRGTDCIHYEHEGTLVTEVKGLYDCTSGEGEEE